MPDRREYILSLFGRFAFTGSDGRDIAPKSAKSQALIALLATSESGGRGRLWLQKRLWPASTPEKAATSLRQALSEIRRALGDDRGLLLTDRRSVSLDMARVTVGPREAGQEFLEGIGLSHIDEGIGAWLKHQRGVFSGARAEDVSLTPATAARPVIIFSGLGGGSDGFELVEDIFIDRVARSLRELLVVEVHVNGHSRPGSHTLGVDVQAFRHDDSRIGLRVRIYRSGSGALVWSGITSTRLMGAPPLEAMEIVSLGNQLIDSLSEALGGEPGGPARTDDPNALMRMALRRAGRGAAGDLEAADRMLAQSVKLGSAARGNAWRAQLRLMERAGLGAGQTGSLAGDAGAYVAEALEAEPQNSLVLAITANARLIADGDAVAAAEFARRSVSCNPSNPMAWTSLAAAKAALGDVAEARNLVDRSRRMSAGAPYGGHWWTAGCERLVASGLADCSRDGAVAEAVLAGHAGVGMAAEAGAAR